MKSSKFLKKPIAMYVSAIIASGFSAQAMAQDAEQVAQVNDEEIEVIEVTGMRGALIRSMDLKRSESGVVDVISSEDMGKFPDTNLAESLQRITGVSVSRSNGEGSQITVRGFGPSFNLITLNGRQMPGTGNTRSYSLENLSSDGVSALEVKKTARAENPSGGLGATVNIVTVKPLNSPGLKYSVSGKAMHDTSVEEGDDFTPEFSALYSNTFADDTFGAAFSFTHSERDFRKESAGVAGWQANVALPDIDAEHIVDNRIDPTGDYFFPRNMGYGIADYERERTNGQVTLQYAPVDSVIMTLDYTMTNAKTGEESINWSQWHDYGGNINAYELDENGTAVFVDMAGNDASTTVSQGTTEVKEKSLGFNVEWQVNDELSFTLDYHDSESKTDNGADDGMDSHGSLVFGSDQLITKTYDFRTGDVPEARVYWNNGTTTLNPNEMDSHFSQFVHNPGKSEVDQLQIDGLWENPYDFPLMHVKFGVAHTKQTMSGSNAWSGLIGGFLFNPNYSDAFPDSMFDYHSTSGFLDEFSHGGAMGYYYDMDFDEAVAYSQYYLNEDTLGDDYFDTTAYRTHLGQGTYSESSVEEETDSIYISSLWELDVYDFPVQISAGLRYEETDVTSKVLQPVPEAVWWKGGSEWHTQYSDAENSYLTQEGEHDVFLPMLDIKVDITDDLVGRASWGKTISRAPLGDLAGGLAVSPSPKIGSRSATSGNPDLDPYEATNLDVTLEWYYDEGSYASVGYFRKDVENFIGSIIETEIVDGIHDIYQGPRWNQAVSDLADQGIQPTNEAIFEQMQQNGATLNAQGYLEANSNDPLMLWDTKKPYNSPDDKMVDGYEVAIQHILGDTGFGFGANATFVDGDVEFDNNSLEQQTPLTGLSDSANFQVFYEKYGLSVKVTYAWRDEYLVGVGQDQGSADNPPQYAKEYGQLDMSVNYDITENFTVFVDAINLNNETEETFGRYEAQFLGVNQYGPRYTLGARYTFKE